MNTKVTPHLQTSLHEWSPKLWPEVEQLSGQYGRLERLDSKSHAEQLYEAFRLDRENQNWTYLPYGPFDQLQAFKNWLDEKAAAQDPMFFSIIDQSTGRASGLAALMRITPEQGVIEVGNIHFSPLLQRTRLATEAMFLMMQYVFEQLGYRRYEWKCNDQNERSKAAALRLGFQYEGTFRQHMVVKGKNRDTAWFSILDSEWPKLKESFQAFLAAENFDSAGQQVRSLTQLRELHHGHF